MFTLGTGGPSIDEPAPAELTGRVDSVRYRDPSSRFTVAVVRTPADETHTVVGTVPALHEGEDVTLQGSWQEDPKFGRQFRAETVRTEVPRDLEGLESYLASDQIRGIGEARAEQIIDAFGEETFDVLESNLERLTEIRGIGESTLEKIREDWNRQQELRELHLFLQSYDLPAHLAEKLHERYGSDALRVLREEPYELCRTVEGVGFTTADRIARSIHLERTSPARLRAGLRHTLEEAAEDGHTYLPREELLEQAAEILEVHRQHSLDEALAGMVAEDQLVEEELSDGTVAVMTKAFRNMEEDIAGALLELLGSSPERNEEKLNEKIDRGSQVDYSTAQRRALKMSFRRGVMLLTGGPGTGKTTVIDGLVRLHRERDRTVKLAAPTGRAAQRLEETTDHPAKTIHRLLGFQPPNSFKHGPDRPLKADLLVIDEMSMVDLWLFHRLIRALDSDTTLVLVGDPDQLPSVGPGNVLQDLMSSDAIDGVHLEEIFRQAQESDIVANAHRINAGTFPDLTNDPEGDCFFLEVDDPGEAVSTVEELASRRLPDHYGMDPLRELQVLAPMYRGTGGVNRLNQVLQQRLNPGEDPPEPFDNRSFRQGDRVMQLRNNYERGIFNGDIGRIEAFHPSKPTVEIRFPRTGTLELEPGEWDDLQLAYAATIHKSQGSEYPAVILVLLTSHYILLKRNLLYTALTRAEDLAVIVGQKKALQIAINNDDVTRRNTLLKRRIRTEAR